MARSRMATEHREVIPRGPATVARAPGATPAALARLQRSAGNSALSRVLAPPRQREGPCPGTGCACCTAPTAGSSVIQRNGAYEITSYSQVYPRPDTWGRAPATPSPVEVYFGRNEATLWPDVQVALGELASRVGALPADARPPHLLLRGYASEDEPDRPALVTARLHAVSAAVQGGGVQTALEPKPDEGAGSSAYRALRRVEVYVGAPPPALDCGQGGQVDCAGAGAHLEVPEAIARAEVLLDHAIARLAPGSVEARPIVEGLFGPTVRPEEVVAKLRAMRAQVGRFARPVAIGAPGGGHLCHNECQPGLKVRTDGRGEAARLLAGPEFAEQPADSKAADVVHESAHGAPELGAKDHAYSWARLFAELTAQLHAENADSYAALVVRLSGGVMPTPAAQVAFAGVKAEQEALIRKARAWIENYLAQAYLQTRDLYPPLSHYLRTGHWPDGELVPYLKRVYVVLHRTFKLALPPTQESLAQVAGIIDRLEQVERAVAGEDILLHAPEVAAPADGTAITLPPALLTLGDEVAQTAEQLRWTLWSREEIPEQLLDAYTGLVRAVAGDFGGPLGGARIIDQVPDVPPQLG